MEEIRSVRQVIVGCRGRGGFIAGEAEGGAGAAGVGGGDAHCEERQNEGYDLNVVARRVGSERRTCSEG